MVGWGRRPGTGIFGGAVKTEVDNIDIVAYLGLDLLTPERTKRGNLTATVEAMG